MNERVKFVAAMPGAEETFVELCERFGISRKQGYKWQERYERKTRTQTNAEPASCCLVLARSLALGRHRSFCDSGCSLAAPDVMNP